MYCPECDEELDYLDTIISKYTRRVVYTLYICHNEGCTGEDLIYHDRNGEPARGDPTGCY